MKKIFAILLVIALLLPVGIVPQVSAAETKPFYLVNWKEKAVDDITYEEYSNIFYMPFFYSNAKWVTEDSIKVSWGTPQELKELFDTFPEGARYINLSALSTAIEVLAEYCFVDKAVPVIAEWLDAYLKEYKEIGGKLDGITVDIEFHEIQTHYIYTQFYQKGDTEVYTKIANHPTYKNNIRQKLEERGFTFYAGASDAVPETYCLYPNSGDAYATSRSIWDSVMRSYLGECINKAVLETLQKHYPKGVVSDYQSKNILPWLKEPGDAGGSLGAGGIQYTAGNSNNDNFYNVRPSKTFFTSGSKPVYTKIAAYNDAVFEDTSFNRFKYDNMLAKSTYLASGNGNVSWWLAPNCYKGAEVTPYYAENVFHLGMLNPQYFLGYMLLADCDKDEDLLFAAFEVVNDCLKELTRVVGAADRKPINVDVNWNWNHDYVLSGMYAGGKNIWRLSPDSNKISLEDFKVKDAAELSFAIGGETITFPQGKIIETGKISGKGSCGYWIETSADVTPVVTRSANYYAENPSFQENYEAYEVGTEYTYNNALPEICWEVKKTGKDGSATIVADPTNADNKVLALKGTYTITNAEMPDNITAGDTFAKHQAWSLSFTLPSDMADNAELILLTATAKKKLDDGGFKIAGGKAYYYKDGEYVEIAGVTLTPGTKYTVVRELDFSDEKACTSDFYIYGADGALLGKAKNVPMDKKTNLPVTKIAFECKNIAGEAVLFDDYKLYPTKVSADITLYDATTGMKVEEIDKAREGNTAYRLSWLNASQTEKSFTVMAAYYDGDTKVSEEVVKEVKMAPNTDGVLTGVVENKNEGKTMLVYLRDNNPAEPEEGETPDATVGSSEPNGSDEPQSDSKLIIIIAAAAVLVIAIVVVVIVVASKKKKVAAAPEAEAVEETVEESAEEITEETTEENNETTEE